MSFDEAVFQSASVDETSGVLTSTLLESVINEVTGNDFEVKVTIKIKDTTYATRTAKIAFEVLECYSTSQTESWAV